MGSKREEAGSIRITFTDPNSRKRLESLLRVVLLEGLRPDGERQSPLCPHGPPHQEETGERSDP